MDPRIALPKPHRGSRQAHRRSRRRYMPRANGQFNPVRYVPPAELRQPTYAKNEGLKAPALYSRRSDEPIWQSRQNEEHGFSYAKDSQNFHKPAPLSVSNHPVSTFANAEQICVSLDYVPDRGRMLWSRWVLILICLTQLLSAFAVIGCHAVDFSEDTKLEVGVSLGILAFGNIFSTGVVTSVLFYRRWRSAETQTRSKTGEANHEAWICTRAALSLIGMAPIARYVELLGIYRRLSRLERSHAKEVKSPPKNSQFQYRDSLPRNPQEPADVDETARELENVHRLRRLFVEFDFDACVVALANASLGAGPFAIAQGVLYLRRLMLSRMMPNSTSGAILASFIFSILWLTSAACQFQPDAHYLSCAELLRLPAHRHQHLVSASGRILLFFARGFHITIRMITFTLFTGLFYWLLAVVVAVHQVLYLLLLLVYRGSKGILSSAYKASPNYRRPLDQRLKTKGILRHLGTDLLYTYVSIFDFFNGSAGKTRLRVIIYYFTYYLENSAMIGAWYAAYPFTASWYHLPALLVVVTVQWIGAIFLQLYFFYFSPSPRGTSLCGLCCPDELRGPVELVYSPAPFTYPPVQNAHHLPPPPIDNLSFILQPTSLYSRRGQLGPEPGHGEPSRTDSLTVVTAEMPRKPRSRYLYVKDPVEDESMEAWNEWEGVEGIIPPEDEDVNGALLKSTVHGLGWPIPKNTDYAFNTYAEGDFTLSKILTTINPPIPLPCPPLVRGGSITTSKHNSTATHGDMLLQTLVISALLTSQSKGFGGSSKAQESLVDVDLGLDGVEEGLEVRKRVMLLPVTGNSATERLRRLIYEVVHCMRPCLNNGIMLLPRNTVDVCRCICPPSHYGIACEYEISGEVKTRRQLF